MTNWLKAHRSRTQHNSLIGDSAWKTSGWLPGVPTTRCSHWYEAIGASVKQDTHIAESQIRKLSPVLERQVAACAPSAARHRQHVHILALAEVYTINDGPEPTRCTIVDPYRRARLEGQDWTSRHPHHMYSSARWSHSLQRRLLHSLVLVA
jgi:hypothetical protein